MRNIVESVRFPHARRWFEGLLRLLVANNRVFCPRAAKMNDYSQSRLTLPARGERRSCQGGCLHAAKRITLAFVSAGHAAKGIMLAFASAGHAAKGIAPALSKRWLACCQGNRAGLCFRRACCGVARAFLLASFQFASLQNDVAAPRFLWGGAFACGVDEVFRYNGPHD